MKDFVFDVEYIREQFPALCKTVGNNPAAFLDGPGGTQVPKRVVDKINDYMFYRNANIHGVFKTSRESDALTAEAKVKVADFLNCDPCEVIFGENSTTNNMKLSYALARTIEPGDEILITEIDHEGNRSPWRILEDFGAVIKNVKINTDDITLDFDDFMSKLSPKTKLLAINWAANSCGTITDVAKYIEEAHKVGAITVVDAVHYAPHRCIDVKKINTDILVCSAYKFFGPHFGVMYIRKELGEKIKSVRVMADDNTEMPYRFETGTVAMEFAAGTAEAVEFIADVGDRHMKYFDDLFPEATGRRKKIMVGMHAIEVYEEGLASQLREKLGAMPGLKIYGPKDPEWRTSTVSFTVDGINAGDIAKKLADKGIFVWDGEYYAIETIFNVLKLEPVGGMLRIGLAPYSIQSEIDRVIECMAEITGN